MKYLPLSDFDTVTTALNFNTPDCSVTGGCDLYTTKTTGSDKKLYKNIDRDLSTHQEELLRLGASLSPPKTEAIISSSPNLAMMHNTTAFGHLSDMSSRKTFAHLIATLNASHPHYDFSNILRPTDFRSETNLRQVMNNINSLLSNVVPHSSPNSFDSPQSSWGPNCWSLIDKEMRLEECTVFSWRPDTDPFEDDDHPIFSAHYFFFNRALKRVAYLYVRIVAVMSSQSPELYSHVPYVTGVSSASRRRTSGSLAGSFNLDSSIPMAIGHRNSNASGIYGSYGAPRKRSLAHGGNSWTGGFEMAGDYDDLDLQPVDEGDDGNMDDGFVWNRGSNGDLLGYSDVEDMDDVDDEVDDDNDFDQQEDLDMMAVPGLAVGYSMSSGVRN